MTPEQRDDFELRRDLIRHKHMKNDPKLRKARRKRRLSVVGAVMGACVTVAVMLLLSKSFLIALHGPRDYAGIMVPEAVTQVPDSPLHVALMPDPISTGIADLMRPILVQTGAVASASPASPALSN